MTTSSCVPRLARLEAKHEFARIAAIFWAARLLMYPPDASIAHQDGIVVDERHGSITVGGFC